MRNEQTRFSPIPHYSAAAVCTRNEHLHARYKQAWRDIITIIMSALKEQVCAAVNEGVIDAVLNPFTGNPTVFQDTPIIRQTHEKALRLGHTNDIRVMLRPNEYYNWSEGVARTEKQSYVRGILVAAVLSFAFYTAWILFL